MTQTDDPADGKVGYGRPPKRHQFKPGQSGNPKGRPKKKAAGKGLDISETLSAPVRIVLNGREKDVHWYEATVRGRVQRALKNGSVKDALAMLQDIKKHGLLAKPDGDSGVTLYPYFMKSDDALYIMKNYPNWRTLFEEWSHGGDRRNFHRIQERRIRNAAKGKSVPKRE
ncbi:MAG: hypothetical protein JJ878_14535 [Alphaproteobacteria bacterium]|nr:hypothetical protein [Alphaproteobacteria bacterium]MBO6863853.1 hypothetical protein [Alphaproteobacteria bacterium]MEC9266732.1 DUF5681 domain-containing protein [Pseudomonadota bacterium]